MFLMAPLCGAFFNLVRLNLSKSLRRLCLRKRYVMKGFYPVLQSLLFENMEQSSC